LDSSPALNGVFDFVGLANCNVVWMFSQLSPPIASFLSTEWIFKVIKACNKKLCDVNHTQEGLIVRWTVSQHRGLQIKLFPKLSSHISVDELFSRPTQLDPFQAWFLQYGIGYVPEGWECSGFPVATHPLWEPDTRFSSAEVEMPEFHWAGCTLKHKMFLFF